MIALELPASGSKREAGRPQRLSMMSSVACVSCRGWGRREDEARIGEHGGGKKEINVGTEGKLAALHGSRLKKDVLSSDKQPLIRPPPLPAGSRAR